MGKLEKERRFLVQLPLSQEAQDVLYQNSPPVNITQIYLVNDNGSVERVRRCSVKLLKQTFNHYFHTQKKFVQVGISDEDERDLSQAEYDVLLNRVDLDRAPIEKDRYYLPYQGKDFELDIFRGQHEGLSILEIELDDLSEPITLPPYLNIIREITTESEYSNYNLAKKKSIN